MAVVSASATPSTPAWSRWRMAPPARIAAWSASSPPIQAPVSCATPTPATSWRSRRPVSGEWICRRCRTPDRMKLIENISTLATCGGEGGQGEIHGIPDAVLVWQGSTIRWVGRRQELPVDYWSAERMDAQGGMVIPGLVDCHTHLAFGGWRADEF